MIHLKNLLALASTSIFAIAPLVSIHAAEETDVIAKVKPSVVAIATFDKLRAPALNFVGTGFAVFDGNTIVTNAHVVEATIGATSSEILGIVTGEGAQGFRAATLLETDPERDLAILKIAGPPLPTLKIAPSNNAREGQSLLFTGFPLGMVLGFHHATHRAMIAAITPIAIPASNSRTLNAKTIQRLRSDPYLVFQLDGTAYPGNSGSPLYDPATGEVYGVINKVFVKGTKETAISHPSGITYAIPSKFVAELLSRHEK